jgi:hypothetical protein
MPNMVESLLGAAAEGKPKLLEQVRDVIRRKHFRRTSAKSTRINRAISAKWPTKTQAATF